MTNKFEIGSVWKTRGGWRAVVVDKREADGWIKVYHSTGIEEAYWTSPDGMFEKRVCDHAYDLIEPWVEPNVHDVWINVYKHKYEKGWICFGEDSDGYPMANKEDADRSAKKGRIACINVKFKEGEGL